MKNQHSQFSKVGLKDLVADAICWKGASNAKDIWVLKARSSVKLTQPSCCSGGFGFCVHLERFPQDFLRHQAILCSESKKMDAFAKSFIFAFFLEHERIILSSRKNANNYPSDNGNQDVFTYC
jgi:hypothetical protein